MITENDILKVLPNLHVAALEMVLETQPRDWADVEMALAWIGYSVELSMRKVRRHPDLHGAYAQDR